MAMPLRFTFLSNSDPRDPFCVARERRRCSGKIASSLFLTTKHKAFVRTLFKWEVNLLIKSSDIVLFFHFSQLLYSFFNRWMRGEPVFKTFCDVRIKGIGKEKMGGGMIGFLKGSIMLGNFFQGFCKTFRVASEHGA